MTSYDILVIVNCNMNDITNVTHIRSDCIEYFNKLMLQPKIICNLFKTLPFILYIWLNPVNVQECLLNAMYNANTVIGYILAF